MGDSANPPAVPSKAMPMKTCACDVATYSDSHPSKCGIFTQSIARFRPIGSIITPEMKLLSMKKMYSVLPEKRNHFDFDISGLQP